MRAVRPIVVFLLSCPLAACGSSDESPPSPPAPSDAADITAEADTPAGDAPAPPEDTPPPPPDPPFDWCAPDTPPDAACFASKRAPDSESVGIARAIGDRLLVTKAPEEVSWDWGEAVMMIGLLQLHRVTGDVRYRDFPQAWMDHHIDAGYKIWSSDTCAPAAVAVALLRDTGDQRYRAVVDDALHYLAEEALRTPEGGLNHLGTSNIVGVSLWADSLFMFGNVFTSWGEHTGEAAPLDDYAEQFAIFTDLMQEDLGYYKHAVYSVLEQTDGIYWARANAWIAAAAYDHLRVRRNRGEPLEAMEAPAAALVAAALASQDPEIGLWWTVPNRPGEGYLETSASALFAFAMARGFRYGWLDESVLPAVHSAMAAVRTRVAFRVGGPVVTGTSGPTTVGKLDYYLTVPIEDDLSYGVGAVLLALTETAGLPAGEVVDPTADLEPTTLEPSAGFLERQADYLALCLATTGPTSGGLYAQSCRVAAGLGDVNDAEVDAAIAKLAAREDTADFRAAGLVRMLYLDDESGALAPERRATIEDALLTFKYWVDEPGKDGMAYWTENHQVLFHSSELLMGQRYPDSVFTNTGRKGAELVEHAAPRLKRWLDLRGRFGFSEWHSNVYFNEDVPALLNLVDFAEDEELRTKASMVLDIVALDLLNNMYRGWFATTHGRTYPNKFIGGLNDSTADFAWITVGLAKPGSGGNFSGAFLATSPHYVPPPALEALAEDVRPTHEHRQRDSIMVEEGPVYGIGYTGLDDIVFWAGMAGLVAPAIIEGTAEILDAFDLWDGFLFGSLPDSVIGLLKLLAATGSLVEFAEDMEALGRGMALEAVNTYVYRTPDYQLAAAQDYKPGMWAAQTLMWQATLDREAFVLTTFPGGIAGVDGIEVEINSPWIGGHLPRCTFHRNVGIIQHRRNPVAPDYAGMVTGDYTHAYFPRDAFDEVVESGRWVFGRKGEGYIGLWSDVQAAWSADPELPYDWVAPGEKNVFVVEMGRAVDDGDFATFVAALEAATVEVDADGVVSYVSPTLGLMEVGWTGTLTVAGAPIDIGPYPRWANAHLRQPWGSKRLVFTAGGQVLDLDFEAGARRLFAAP